MTNHTALGCLALTLLVVLILSFFNLWIKLFLLILGISVALALFLAWIFLREKSEAWLIRHKIRTLCKRYPDNKDLQVVKELVEEWYNEIKL